MGCAYGDSFSFFFSLNFCHKNNIVKVSLFQQISCTIGSSCRKFLSTHNLCNHYMNIYFDCSQYEMSSVSCDIKKNNFSTLISCNEARLLFRTKPATLNNRSEGTEVATSHKYFLASKDKLGKDACFSFHQVRGLSVNNAGFSVLYRVSSNKMTSSFDTVVVAHGDEEFT